MKYRFLQIPVQDPSAAERELNALCAGKRIAGIEKHFVAAGTDSFWALCISYLDPPNAAAEPARKAKIDYREVLDQKEFAVYAKLRTLRSGGRSGTAGANRYRIAKQKRAHFSS